MKIVGKILVALFVGFALCTALSCSEKEGGAAVAEVDEGFTVYKAGDVLGAWEEGSLDIHYINTGRGESSFLIFPDGTTLIIDFAGYARSDGQEIPFKPNGTVLSEDVIINYINHFTSQVSKGHIDYALASHFHGDHTGLYSSSLPTGGDGSFKLISMCAVGERLPFGHYLDRVYPDYSHYTLTSPGQNLSNLQKFLTWTAAENGTVAEGFNPGGLNQIHMLYDPDSYPSFKIQNLTCSGKYWTGVGEEYELKIPDNYDDFTDDELPNGNVYSCAFWLTFGMFDYFTGGDLQFTNRDTYSYMDSEAPLIGVIGEMDVNKANHHGSSNCNSSEFMEATHPTVWIVNTWCAIHPNGNTVQRVIDANPSCALYATNIGPTSTSDPSDFVATQGHIVVRVPPSATKYYVYVLEDSDFSYKVKSVHSYNCK